LTKIDSSDDLNELAGAFTIALALICNRLIDRGALDREAIKSDLAAEVERLRKSDPSAVKEMILSGLAFALHAPRPHDEIRPTGSPPSQRDDNDAVHLLEIDDAVERLKLIGSEG
jgi:hypothetical protein